MARKKKTTWSTDRKNASVELTTHKPGTPDEHHIIKASLSTGREYNDQVIGSQEQARSFAAGVAVGADIAIKSFKSPSVVQAYQSLPLRAEHVDPNKHLGRQNVWKNLREEAREAGYNLTSWTDVDIHRMHGWLYSVNDEDSWPECLEEFVFQ